MSTASEPRACGNLFTLFIVTFTLGVLIGGITLYAYWAVATQRWLYSAGVAFVVLTSSVVTFKWFTGKWSDAWMLTVPLVHPLAVVVVVCMVVFRLIGVGGKPAPVAPTVAPPANVANTVTATPKPKANTAQ